MYSIGGYGLQDFNFAAPTSLKEAISLLNSSEGANARILSGGSDLLPMLRSGRRTASLVIDGKNIPELNEITLNSSGLTVGAAVPCRNIYENKAVSKAYPSLADSAMLIGSVQIQGRASVGGNLCNSAPSADCIPTLIALDAKAVIAGKNGTREIPVDQFCTGPGRNVMQPGEMLVSIKFPAPQKNSGGHYMRFIPRNEMDIAVAGAGVQVVLDPTKQKFVSARIALASVAPTPVLAKAAGDGLAGKPVNEASIMEAAEAAKAAAKPISDMRGTVEQRIQLVGVLTARALRKAVERAKEA